MRKPGILFCLLIISFLHQTMFSQKLPIKLGLKLAPNIAWINTNTKGYSSDGVSGGAVLGFVSDIYFMEHYAFSTGFNFSFLNGKLKEQELMILGKDTLTGTLSRKYNFIYMEIPLMVKMQTKKFGNFSFYGQIGFGTGFRIKATTKDNFQPEQGDQINEKIDITDNTSLIRESILIGLGTEFYLDESTCIFFGFSYSNSLNNILTGTNKLTGYSEKGFLNYVELSLGILF